MTIAWRKSSYSNANGNCVEVGVPKKSSYSTSNGSCVEVEGDYTGGVLVRDTKLGLNSPILEYTRNEWRAFIDGVKAGEFDLE